MVTPEERIERLSIDIDTRLTELWMEVTSPGHPVREALDKDPDLRDALGGVVRAAYGRGYVDALNEDKAGRRAELHKTNGYKPI